MGRRSGSTKCCCNTRVSVRTVRGAWCRRSGSYETPFLRGNVLGDSQTLKFPRTASKQAATGRGINSGDQSPLFTASRNSVTRKHRLYKCATSVSSAVNVNVGKVDSGQGPVIVDSGSVYKYQSFMTFWIASATPAAPSRSAT